MIHKLKPKWLYEIVNYINSHVVDGAQCCKDYYVVPNHSNVSTTMCIEFLYDTLKPSPICFVAMVIYIDRIKQKHKKMCINSSNIINLMFVCMVLALKFFHDQESEHKTICALLGLRLSDLPLLEVMTLKNLEYELCILHDVIKQYTHIIKITDVHSFYKSDFYELTNDFDQLI